MITEKGGREEEENIREKIIKQRNPYDVSRSSSPEGLLGSGNSTGNEKGEGGGRAEKQSRVLPSTGARIGSPSPSWTPRDGERDGDMRDGAGEI